jgi:hypothetical protein
MEEPTFTLTKKSLVSLLGSVFGRPHPDDPGDPSNPWGPYGPVGPWIRPLHYWGMLNPQPLPPIDGPLPDPWRWGAFALPWKLGPVPDPWRFAFVIRTMIGTILSQHQLAEALSGESGKSTEAMGKRINLVADWICGNEPISILIPVPPGPPGDDEPRPIHPEEVLAAAVQFQLTARQLRRHPIHVKLAQAADHLLKVGVEGLKHN